MAVITSMNSTTITGQPSRPPVTRVAVVFADLGRLNTNALKYLVTHLNTLQCSIEFELIAISRNDPLLQLLRHGQVANRNQCRSMLSSFHGRVLGQFAAEQEEYDLVDRSVPSGVVVVSLARFSDEHYGLKSGKVQIQALGEWNRRMAPPSIFEFIITLLMRQSAAFVAPSVSKSIHLGTKGCLFDFTADLSDARYKALQAYICSVCRARLQDSDAPLLADDLVRVLETKWLGVTKDPSCPAAIVSKLGYDLFRTKGIQPSLSENLRALLRDEATKALFTLFAAVLAGWLLYRLGVK